MTHADLNILPVPAISHRGRPLQNFERRELERYREMLMDPARSYFKDGAQFWTVNDSPVPESVYRDAYVEEPPNQKAARDADTAAFVKRYRAQRRNRKLTAEQRFEMRAAFGPGETVVDVITGQKWRT